MKDKPGPFVRYLLVVCAALLVFGSAPAESASGTRSPAPDFEASDLDGIVQRLSAYRGRVVVLNFWATWCAECIRELPSLSSFSVSHPDTVVLGIASDRDNRSVKRFLSERPAGYPVIVDTTGDLFVKKYRIRVLPTTVLIDRSGSVAERILGAEDFTSRGFLGKIRALQEASH